MKKKSKRPVSLSDYKPSEEEREERFWDEVEHTGNPRFSGTSFPGEYNRQEQAMTEHDDGLGAYRDED